MGKATIYIEHDKEIRPADALRIIADQIEGGEIRCTGIETRMNEESGTFFVKDCGGVELMIHAPYCTEFPEYSVNEKNILSFELRKKVTT